MFDIFKKWKYALHFLREQPVSEVFGFDRGTPIDRYYIEKFLSAHRVHIQGRVGEIADNRYTQLFGTQVKESLVFSYDKSANESIPIDLTKKETLQAFDQRLNCFILTQTLNFIPNLQAAIEGIHYMLTEGGTALITTAALSPLSEYDNVRWGDYWRFMPRGLEEALKQKFHSVSVQVYGNAATASWFIKGYAIEDVLKSGINPDIQDVRFPVIVSACATK